MAPEMANCSGKVHGGAILRLLDQVAYACASRYAGSYVVTLSVDQVMFRQPIAVGELVTFLASVNYTGTSSMEIGIKVLLFHDGGGGRQGRADRRAAAGARRSPLAT
ncbi:hypothetical protein G6F31_020343 [Rhizopus arrhizus]|nr:hypothetical protein G6F31_020343 [Rhizopus arrhizus]